MEALNPVDNQLPKYLKERDMKLQQLTTARQPYVGDWFDLNSSNFSYNSGVPSLANNFYVNIVNIVPSSYFVLGDKVRLKQVGYTSYRYFYIVYVDDVNLVIVLAGDKDSPMTNAVISKIGYSKNALPAGFPTVLFYTPIVYGTSGEIVNYCYFRMVGNMVTANFVVTSNSDDINYAISPPTASVRPATYQYITVTDGAIATYSGEAYMDTISSPSRIAFFLLTVAGAGITTSDWTNSGVKSVDGKMDYPIGPTF